MIDLHSQGVLKNLLKLLYFFFFIFIHNFQKSEIYLSSKYNMFELPLKS